MKKWKRFLGFMICLVSLFLWTGTDTEAASLENNKYITLSPDEKAFTTNAGDQDTEWYKDKETVITGVESTFRELKVGEHYYKSARNGIVPIGKWEVNHVSGQCIHNLYLEELYYHGLTFTRKKCMSNYYSGWMGYCADCGEMVTPMLIYASREAVSTLKDLDLTLDYYYLCPFCTNLEQGREFGLHYCQAVSWNCYKIRYFSNFGSGYMDNSFHMYNNETFYEGEEVNAQTHLSKNTFTRKGYEFVGWNTEVDGSGQAFTDEQEIYNLTLNDKEVISLYAQWKKSESILEIDPAGGSYDGNAGISSFKDLYRATYKAEPGKLVPPAGHTVSFDTQGGTPVASLVQKRSFQEWKMEGTFAGKFDFKTNIYTYLGREGNRDRLTAVYDYGSIVLPGAEKENSSFGGWYYDPECTKPAGAAGDRITPDKDVTLYAKWVDLVLKSVDNYFADGGKGAVNLSWSQNDGRTKNYMLYQSRDNQNWTKVLGTADISNSNASIKETFGFSGQVQSYTVPYTGLYTITASGAQGGNWGNAAGGAGGKTTGDIWLTKGQVLQINVGGQNGYNGGGAGTYAAGGGLTDVKLNGTLLMIAGGGGGATPGKAGGSGGLTASVIAGNTGQAGSGGGGGGYQGGTSGSYVTHAHAAGCYHYHSGSVLGGGGCYTVPHDIPQQVNCTITFYTISDTYTCGRCFTGTVTFTSYYALHQYENNCDEHGQKTGWRSTCDYCGLSNGGGDIPGGTHMTTVYHKEYSLGCGLDQGSIICGMASGQVLADTPSYGGSNYGNITLLKNYSQGAGTQTGNGSVTITSESAGFVEVQALDGVKATDLAAPDAVQENKIYKDADPDSENRVIISWEAPPDYGTTYYHRAESFLAGTTSVLSNSNVTSNTLTSGVSGYYYLVDGFPGTAVNSSNGAFLKEPGKNTRARVTVNITTQQQYLHVAAVDVAGNTSSTVHVPVGKKDPDVAWSLETEKIGIRSQESVYPAGQPDTYYVRCDEVTPVRLSFRSVVKGDASVEYQITHSIFESQMGTGEAAQMDVYTERAPMTEGSVTTGADKLKKTVSGIPALTDDMYTVTERTDWCRNLAITQDFTLKKDTDGKKVRVTPVAGAEFREDVVYSDHDRDLENSIWLIGDCTPPDISGLEELKAIEVIDRDTDSYTLNFTASDSGSGMREFYITVTNKDNGTTRTFKAEDGKHISLCISEDDALYTGDFTVELHAVDNVGNERVESHDISEFTLRVSLERILEPHDPVFRAGESGVLKITTTGYADRVEVVFPEAMTALNPELDTVYVYEPATFVKEEELVFMIPLGTPVDSYQITVRAFKKDARLEDYPKLGVIETQGNVLENIQKHLK